jgi:hypothetical protein
MNTVLILLGLVFLGLATFNVSFPRINSLATGLFCICLAQYGPPLLAAMH